MSYDFSTAAGGEVVLLEQLAYDPRDNYQQYTTSAAASSALTTASPITMSPVSQSNRQSPGVSWQVSFDMTAPVAAVAGTHSPTSQSHSVSSPEDSPQAPSPGHHSSAASSPLQHQLSPFQTAAHPLLTDWALQQQQQQQQQAQPQQTQIPQDLQLYQDNTAAALMSFNPFVQANFPHAIEYLPATTTATLDTAIQLEPTFNSISPVDDSAQQQAMQWSLGMANWQDFGAAAMTYAQADGLPRVSSLGSHSPTNSYLEVLSLGSGSDNGWATVDFPAYETAAAAFQQQVQNTAIFNPGQTLHLRSNSDSSNSDGGNSLDFGNSSLEFGSYEEVNFPYSPFSPESDTLDSTAAHRGCFRSDGHQHQHHHHHQAAPAEIISPAAAVGPMPIKAAAPSSRPAQASGSGAGASSSSASPPARRSSGPRKSPIAKPTKAVTRRTSTGKEAGTGEKKVGRRKGPLRPDQRKQASEIRKLRACLRCKFLKKTCDKGEPCAGCKPSHARLWQVPCTRIDIKDVNYFMKDWKADYERHLDRGVSVYNVKGFSQKETLMWITHGYGYCLPVMVREVFVADDSCFHVDWVESHLTDQEPIDFEIRTERLDVGQEGIRIDALDEYLDKHIDQSWENFVDDHFDGTPFISEILKTAHRFYVKEKSPVIRKALKLVLAYNLTLHITLVEQQGSENMAEGQIDDEDSKYFGKVVAPVMINFQIKCAMADMWRELQKDILEELSALYSSVYSGDRLKNWPTIFMLAAILLCVWEEMQFDCHYRVPDPIAVDKFCNDMESMPVGVIVGLFHAISQKLPAFTDWDTRRHGQLLNNNPAVCEAMTEVRQHVIKHEAYLRTRQDAKFDRYDFDSLSNKFLSKLVIRAN
ncbi:hypothetical protein RB595_002479 [Gaeumannomyces hyphopodioides]